MKTLYLIRHAKSDHNGNLDDINRPLNIRGYHDAYGMSDVMNKKKFIPDLIISSPAIRAFSTALIFCRKFNINPSDIIINSNLYETDVNHYLDIVAHSDDKYDSIMLFAHNPTISNFANILTKPFNDNISTCGIIGITNNCTHWKNFADTIGELKLYDSPKNYSNKS